MIDQQQKYVASGTFYKLPQNGYIPSCMYYGATKRAAKEREGMLFNYFVSQAFSSFLLELNGE